MEFEVEVASDEFITKLIKNLQREYDRVFTDDDRKKEIIDEIVRLRESQRPIINIHNGPRSIF